MIQPSVVTKIGATIDMDNFFEGDVAGNIAALLGIDPANIRVTNIVRESRKKRWAPFAPTWDMSENIVMEMTIEPPPKTSLNSSTTMGGGAAMEIGDLKTAMADLSNGFQNGSIGGALGMNVTTMAMQEPIYVPTPEDLPPKTSLNSTTTMGGGAAMDVTTMAMQEPIYVPTYQMASRMDR